MLAEVLYRVFDDPKDIGSLGGDERHLTLSRQLHSPGATGTNVEEYLRSEQAYTVHKLARRRFIRNYT